MKLPQPALGRGMYETEKEWVINNYDFWIYNIVDGHPSEITSYESHHKIERLRAILRYDFKRLNE